MESGARVRVIVWAGRPLLALVVCLFVAAGGASVPAARAATPAGHVSAGATGRAWARHSAVPILVYHHVQSYLGGNYLLYVGTWQFAGELSFLRHHGYHPVTMTQVWDDWTGGERLPSRPVVLSFDDGYADQYANAARQLRRYHWPAVLDLVVDRGTALSNAMVRRMVRWGWEIASHTVNHYVLTRVSPATLRRQLVDSRRILRHEFGQPVDFFCYPGGVYDRRVERAVKSAGYLAATSVRYGAATPARRLALPRIAVYWGESLGTFGSRMRRAVAEAR